MTVLSYITIVIASIFEKLSPIMPTGLQDKALHGAGAYIELLTYYR